MTRVDGPRLSAFADGFLLPLILIARLSGWLDRMGKSAAAWLLPDE